MKHIFFAGCLLAISTIAIAQTPAAKILYGAITKENLATAPYDQWFDSSYEAYKPNADIINSIKKLNAKDISVQVFMGTWCGDSRREVPRFLKLANDLGWSENNVKIIAVGGSDSLYKQSPQGEDAGKGIFRVPVFIIYKNGVEINRITEFPAYSLERDLLAILSGKEYNSNYRSFPVIRNWLANGILSDKNNSSRGLAMQLKPLVGGENELNSLAYLLLKQQRKQEALKVFLINANLYPESANVFSSLGEGYLKNGDNKNAVVYLERALDLNKDPKMLKDILSLLYEAKREAVSF